MKHTPKRMMSILAAAALTCCSLPQSAPQLLRPARKQVRDDHEIYRHGY